MADEVDKICNAVSLAWQFRASQRPGDAVAIAEEWIGRKLPHTDEGRAELGELYRCASLCVRGSESSLWRERSLLLFALTNCGNGLATLLIPVAFGILQDPVGGPDLALNWLEGMSSLIGNGYCEAGPSTGLTTRLYWEKVGYVQYERGRFEESERSYVQAEKQVDRSADPRAWVKVHLGALRPRWELIADHSSLLLEQEELVKEGRELGDRAADVLAIAEANLDLMRAGEQPRHPYEIV